jgi:hypothetical protein
MSARQLLERLASEDEKHSRQEYPSTFSSWFPSHGDFTVVFGTVRVFHHNVEERHVSLRMINRQG